jgi:hypothetical protein
VKSWYARVKSRPSMRPMLLGEKVLGMPPAPTYADLDFLSTVGACQLDNKSSEDKLLAAAPAAKAETALGFRRLKRLQPAPMRSRRRPERLKAFLDAGYHGTMGWMAETARSPGGIRGSLWPEVRSVIMLAMNYGPGGCPGEPAAGASG